jgi:hypothetical protein
MQAKVREEAFTYLSLMAAGWEIRDPWCAAQATEERIGVVADQFVAMVSRSDSLLQSVASSGIIGNVIMMMNALFPIVREVWRAHGPGGHGHQDQGGDEGDVTARYPAYAAS